MTPAELLAQLTLRGGTIARAQDCTVEQLDGAMKDNRFAIDSAGNGFVLLSEAFTTNPAHMPA